MKNKKSLLSLGLLALVLVLGVGYAVVSNVQLTFGGEANVGEAALKVDIESVTDKNADGDRTVTHTFKQHDTADTFTIDNMTLNEEVTMTYTIANHETDINAEIMLEGEITNTNFKYFTVTCDLENGARKTIDAEGTTTVIVKVKMIKTPLNSENASATFSFKLYAKPTGETTN